MTSSFLGSRVESVKRVPVFPGISLPTSSEIGAHNARVAATCPNVRREAQESGGTSRSFA